jgi:aldehyde:ferredoxin oxidoreductase
MYSYAGKILRVNLSTGETATEPLTETIVKQYIGGVSLGLRLLVDNSQVGVDAFDPQNPLVFVTGPLTGTLGPAAGNGYVVVSKSPATGAAIAAVGHSFLGAELKRAGYDALIITGKASKLSTLWIDDDKTQLINAEHLENATATKTQKVLREELSDFYIRISCIGEAGEKLCRFASIVDDELCVFGRGGLGAVMGSKSLKAIAVREPKMFTLPTWRLC